MTPEQKEAYLKNPRLCPYCQSPDITAGDHHGEGDFGDPHVIYCIMTCDDCSKLWMDQFRLVGVQSEEEVMDDAGGIP